MSFAMPEGPAGGGLVGLVAFVPGIQAQFVPTFTYVSADSARQRVADDRTFSSGETAPDLASLPATGNDTGVLLVAAVGAVVSGVGLLALARRRSSR